MILPSEWYVCSAKPVLSAELGAANESVDRKNMEGAGTVAHGQVLPLLHSRGQEER